MLKQQRISVIVPICGGADRLGPLLETLRSQTIPIHEVIVVDNASTAATSVPEGVQYILNRGTRTISGNYNLGVKHATGDLVLLTQQDCQPVDGTMLERLLTGFREDDWGAVDNHPIRPEEPSCPVVAATGMVTLPKSIFQTYGFWGKVLMAKWVGTTQQGISGKFDLVRRDAFKCIGGYDCEHFRFAGEDLDLCVRLAEKGRVVVTDAEVIHHHHQGNETSASYVVAKCYAYAEGFGAALRRHGFKMTRIPYAKRWTHHLNKFFYPILLAVPFFPFESVALLMVLTNVAQFQSFRAGTLLLPILFFFNPLLFLIGAAGTLVGFLRGRQIFRP